MTLPIPGGRCKRREAACAERAPLPRCLSLSRRVASLVDYLRAHNPEVAGSNPAPAMEGSPLAERASCFLTDVAISPRYQGGTKSAYRRAESMPALVAGRTFY